MSTRPGGSGGLAPSKSTIYVSNLPFSLTNNDLHQIFTKYGTVVKVTVMRDRVTRKSKGVAFVLYLERDSAYKAVRSLNNTKMFERTIKCSMAKDNGRAPEFIRRKEYKDKTRCYECGEEGHLSYACPKNILGEREPPPKKEKKKKRKQNGEFYDSDEEDSRSDEDKGDDPKLDSLAAAINYQNQKMEEEVISRYRDPSLFTVADSEEPKRKKYKKDAYFSDEEELDDA
ncbi:hypothetical protein ACJMK2_017232 [Sinanodonta woodiana]|uniref:Zinc finger CCHC-type and RNA-binding motif-containing protein 1 n=1 Tax=Sinanodonta woodiana TaxID=1069815 RepID=A0ABD3UXA3_SINWO